MQKECDQKQRFSLRKLSVGLFSVLVGVSFMAINAGQTVHADELQTPSQPDSAVQKANNAANDTANANEQNQTKSDTAQATNHADPNNNQQQNADKNTGATATNAIVKQNDNVVPESNENTGATAKDDSNKVQENVNAPQNVIADQKRQAMTTFAVEKANKPITATMLTENKIADAQNSNSNINKGVDPVKFAANGGFDPKIWGTMDISKWQLDRRGNITGYTGDMSHIIIPNASDFAKAGKSYRQISISSDEMRKLGSKTDNKANTLAISLTNDKKVKATNADWRNAFAWPKLRQANLEGLDTSMVTDMRHMFGNVHGLANLDVSNWDTSKVTNMSNMFSGTSSLTSLDVSNWKTGNVTDMSHMFDGASSLKSLDLSKWDTGNVTDMSLMFGDTDNLTILDVSNWDTSKVTDMNLMFDGASSLTSLDVSKWNTGNVTDMSHMFDGASSLKSLDVSNWDTSNVTNMSAMFASASGLTSLDVSNWNTSKVTDMGDMFSSASSLTSLDVSNWDTSKVTSMEFMFHNASSLTSLDVSKWNTGNVTDMWSMFDGASSLTNLDVSNWDTSKVTRMRWMFDGAKRLTSLNVSNWKTGNVTDMSEMFRNASNLTSLDVSNWDISKVTYISWMFDGASRLTLIANSPSDWQNAANHNAFDGVPVIITNNVNILNVTDNGDYTVDGNSIVRSVIFDSANSALKLPVYKGYANYTSDADRLKYASDVIKVYNDKLMKDYNKMHSDRTLNYADDQDMNDPIALARAKFVTVAKQEDIQDNQANHDKLHATATREYIIHNIDGSITTITQSINYHRTGKHNLVTNEDTFTEWIYSPDKNSVVVVVTKDKNGKAIANPVTVEGDNCIERNGKAYFGSIKIKPKAGFKLVLDKPATAKLNLQAKLASRLLPRQFFVLKAFAPMPHKMTKQVASTNSIKTNQDHASAPIEPITSANAIKQGKDVIVKPVVKTIEPNEQATIHDQTHTGSPTNDFANIESQLADVQNISMTNSKQAKPDFNNQGSMQIANPLATNSQKSVADKSRLQHPVTRTNSKVKSAEITAKSADSCQNKKFFAEKASAKSVTDISTKAEKVAVKSAVNILAKTMQSVPEKTALMTNSKQSNTSNSLPQTSSANDLGATVIGLIMSGLGIALAGIKKRE